MTGNHIIHPRNLVISLVWKYNRVICCCYFVAAFTQFYLKSNEVSYVWLI